MSKQRIRVKHQKTLRQTVLIFTLMIILFCVSYYATPLNLSYLSKGITKIGGIMNQFFHPDFTVLSSFLSGLWDTLAIAFVGLVTALLFSCPLSFLVARNTAPSKHIAQIIRVLFSFIRAVPITIWGLIGAASIGFGSQAGVLGLFLPTMSYLVRVLSERIEEGGNEIYEALSAVGAPWIVIMFKGLFVQLLPQFLSVIMLRFELTATETISLGMVGIAGIGYALNMSIGMYKFSVAIVGIILIYITMLLIETLSRLTVNLIRKDR